MTVSFPASKSALEFAKVKSSHGLTKSWGTADVYKSKGGYDSTDETRGQREIREQTTVGINGGSIDGRIYKRRIHQRCVIDCTIE